MDYKGKVGKNDGKSLGLPAFMLAIKLGFWVIYLSFARAIVGWSNGRLWLNWIEQLTTDQ